MARRLASADIPTGPTLAAWGEDIARNVAFTAPLKAAAVDSLTVEFCELDGISIGCELLQYVRCKSHGWRRICAAVGRRLGTMCNICRIKSFASAEMEFQICVEKR